MHLKQVCSPFVQTVWKFATAPPMARRLGGPYGSEAEHDVLQAVNQDYVRLETAPFYDKEKIRFFANALKQPVVDTRSNTRFALGCSLSFYVLVICYAVYAFVAFFNRPYTTDYTMEPMGSFPPVCCPVVLWCAMVCQQARVCLDKGDCSAEG